MNCLAFLMICVMVAVQLTLMVWAIVDLTQRRTVTWNNKWVWVAIIVLLSTIGPIIYFVAGRPAEPATKSGDKAK